MALHQSFSLFSLQYLYRKITLIHHLALPFCYPLICIKALRETPQRLSFLYIYDIRYMRPIRVLVTAPFGGPSQAFMIFMDCVLSAATRYNPAFADHLMP